ncbi:MAG: hypothetical protein C5S38_06875 [Candidatus Methanophagaceae archaeon]|nr:MAG: hypothetical protein C5S38_06875 [Methanophagales archaeon]
MIELALELYAKNKKMRGKPLTKLIRPFPQF